jgi:hypothetical protein
MNTKIKLKNIKKSKTKKNKKNKNTKGGADSSLSRIDEYIPLYIRDTTFTTLVSMRIINENEEIGEEPYNGTHCVYGSSLPMFYLDRTIGEPNHIQRVGRQHAAFRMFLYCILNCGIYNFYSFQACDEVPLIVPVGDDPHPHRNSCFPRPRVGPNNWERLQFERARELAVNIAPAALTMPITFTNIMINDMTPGFLGAWVRMSLIPNPRPKENSALFHCAAGLGRTGIALLYMWYRETYNANYFVRGNFFNQDNSETLYNGLRTRILPLLSVPQSTYPQQNAVLNDPPTLIQEIINEVTNINDFFHAKLFVARMNYIIISICMYKRYTGPIQFFKVPQVPAIFTANNIFEYDVANNPPVFYAFPGVQTQHNVVTYSGYTLPQAVMLP